MFKALVRRFARHKDINWAFADQALVSGVNFLTGILLARYMGLEEFGRFTLVWLVARFLNNTQFSLISAPMMSIGPLKTDREWPAYLGAILVQQVAVSGLSFVLLWAGVRTSGTIFPEWQAQDYALPLGLAGAAFQMQDFVRRYFFTRTRPAMAFSNDAIRYLGQLVLVFALFASSTLNTVSALYIYALTGVIATAAGIAAMRPIEFKWSILREVTTRHWHFSKWVLVSTQLSQLTNYPLIWALGAFAGSSIVGLFVAARNIVAVLHVVYQGFDNFMRPRSAQQLASGGILRLITFIRRAMSLLAIPVGMICLTAVLFPGGIAKLFYGDLLVGHELIVVLFAISYFILYLALPFRYFFITLSDTRPLAIVDGVLSGISILLCVPVVLYTSLIGTVVFTIILNATRVWMLYRYSRFSYHQHAHGSARYHSIEVGAISDTEVQVSWSTDEPTTGTVEYGLNTNYGSSVTDPVSAYDHSVVVGGLTPFSQYHFRISAEDQIGPPGDSSVSGDFIAFTSEAPFIDVWYGDHQKFGNIGESQLWINVLGNVSDPDGIASLTYTLNGAPGNGVTGPDLTVGPNKNRLAITGDFNVEIAFSDLVAGQNNVEITATDKLGNEAIKTVTIDYPGGNVWPSDYTIDWSTVTDIQDVAQVVDGLWTIENGTVRPVELGNDRLIAIGDIQWDNYEVTVPFTLHGFQPHCPRIHGVGVLVRWPGHYDWTSTQPRWGWYPMGGLGWYRPFPSGSAIQMIRGSNGTGAGAAIPTTLDLETPYMIKIRAETLPAADLHRYSFKVWEASQPEPAAWDIEFDEVLTETSNGSLLLLAHYTDVSFGNVTVTSIDVSNQAPTANDDAGMVATGGAVNIDVLANDTDADGTIDPTSVTVVQPPASGTVAGDGNGLLTYTHGLGDDE